MSSEELLAATATSRSAIIKCSEFIPHYLFPPCAAMHALSYAAERGMHECSPTKVPPHIFVSTHSEYAHVY